jgi:hypothetical protein
VFRDMPNLLTIDGWVEVFYNYLYIWLPLTLVLIAFGFFQEKDGDK